MNAFILTASASEITHLLRAETAAAHGQLELNTTCEKDYIIDEDVDYRTYGIRLEERCDLVTSIATLTIEPRRESGYWVLSMIVERAFGLVSTFEEDDMTPAKLTLDEFDLEFRSVGQKSNRARRYTVDETSSRVTCASKVDASSYDAIDEIVGRAILTGAKFRAPSRYSRRRAAGRDLTLPSLSRGAMMDGYPMPSAST